MEKITEVNIFDFDETFVRAPGYTNKKAVERAHPELKFNTAYEYYDHSKSLCEEIHNIQVIKPVYDAWKSGIDSPNVLSVLITHRTEELKEDVKAILDKRDVTFDQYHFLGRVSNKPSILHQILNTYLGITKVRVFEDSVQQLALYQNFFKENDIKVELEMYIVDKSRMYRISKFELYDETNIVLL